MCLTILQGAQTLGSADLPWYQDQSALQAWTVHDVNQAQLLYFAEEDMGTQRIEVICRVVTSEPYATEAWDQTISFFCVYVLEQRTFV